MTRIILGRIRRALALSSNLFAVACLFSACSAFCMGRLPPGTSQGDSAEMHAQEGLQFAQTGNLQAAEEEFRKAVALTPDNAGFLQELGTILAIEKKLEESTSVFEKALR